MPAGGNRLGAMPAPRVERSAVEQRAPCSWCLSSHGVSHVQLRERFRRASVPLADEPVPLILEIGDTYLRCPEAAGSKVAEAAEKRHGLAERVRRASGKRNVVEQLPPLGIGAFEEGLVEALGTRVIDQGQAAAHVRLA